MITFDHHTLRLFGMPVFTLLVGIVFVAALAGFISGVLCWRRPAGKFAVIASLSLFLVYALAMVLVVITLAIGSMG